MRHDNFLIQNRNAAADGAHSQASILHDPVPQVSASVYLLADDTDRHRAQRQQM